MTSGKKGNKRGETFQEMIGNNLLLSNYRTITVIISYLENTLILSNYETENNAKNCYYIPIGNFYCVIGCSQYERHKLNIYFNWMYLYL